ncbi:MAG: hypothetical protein WCG82_08755 [Bacteroidota bacterium]
MNRRQALKTLTALAALIYLLKLELFINSRPLKIHFIGLGGAGSNVIEHIHKKGIDARYTCISSPERPHLPRDIEFILFGTEEHDYRTYKEKIKDLEISDEIQNLFNSDSYFVLFTGFGGITGTNLTRQLSAMLHQKNKEFMAIYTMPFNFEGPSRKAFTLQAKQAMDGFSNAHSIDLEVILQKYRNEKLNVAFQKADEHCYQLFRKNILMQSSDPSLIYSLPL